MKIARLRELEDEQIKILQRRSQEGNIEASRVLLKHLRATSKSIED